MDNIFFVGAAGDDIVIMRPVPGRLTREQALNLAAWIVAISDEDEFAEVLKKVQNT